MQDNYNILLSKLKAFIRKYYLNQLFRGGIWFITLFVLFFLLVNVFEYFAWSSPGVRTTLFYTYILFNAIILVRLVIIPLFRLFRIGKTIGDEEAALMIGDHFPEVRDKLLNTIQLKRLSRESGTLELLNASIEQKTKSLHPVPFVKAVDLKRNRVYLKYAIPPLMLLFAILLASPSTITEPSQRLLKHRAVFEKPLPFTIRILNEKMEAVRYDDFTLRLEIDGDKMPASVYFLEGENMIPFMKEPSGEYTHVMNKLQQDIQFNILAEDYSFGPYLIKVLPRPVITSYEVALDYPKYTGKQNEVLKNTGDLIVPEGTHANWKIITRDAYSVLFGFPDEQIIVEEKGSNAYEYDRLLMENTMYSISVSNEFMANPDTISFAVQVIKDNYPAAVFEEFRDSVFDRRLYFRGQISDDYGFTNLTFNYEFLNNFDSARTEGKVYRDPVPITSASTRQMVFHHFDLGRLNVKPGDEVQYYFEVWDNDEVNGYKSSRSHTMIFRAPSLEEINEQAEQGNNEIKEDMEDLIRESRMLQEQIKKLNKELINKESLSWQDKEQLRQLLDQQEQLQERLDVLQEKNEQNILREEEYKEQSEQILRKQEELEELFNEIMNEEMKELFEELQKMLEDIRKDEVQEMLEKMEMSAEDIEKNLDRNLELFKQLEFEKKLTETIERLDELAEEQKELSDRSESKDGDQQELSEEQEKLKDEFNEISEDLNELEELNKELENSHKMEDTDEIENSILEEMDNSMENLEKGKMKKASESQQKSAQDMQEMSMMLSSMQADMQQQSNAEDINVIREILENLLIISFDQEELIGELNNTSYADPKYQEIISDQFELQSNMQIIEDSLYALSKRQAMIKPFVYKELDNIRDNIDESTDFMNNRRKGNALVSQQYAMTSMNNLALFLTEALNQMQKEQNMNMPGSGSCSNPGQGQPSKMPQSMSELQKQLNNQMQRMKSGKKNPGEKGSEGSLPGMSDSEQFARMAAEQEMIRQKMQQYLDELKEGGQAGDAGLNKLMQDMEKTEEDLVNKRLTEETMQRQEEIMTRLLKHEKAIREREKEERRESKESKSQKYSNPDNFLEYKRILSKEVELLKTVPPNLKPYYKRKVNEYFYNFGN